MIRFVFGAAAVLVAILVNPEAMVPGFNSADVVQVAAPLALVVIVFWPRRRRPKRPVSSHFVQHIDDLHPNAISRLDELDGVDRRRDDHTL